MKKQDTELFQKTIIFSSDPDGKYFPVVLNTIQAKLGRQRNGNSSEQKYNYYIHATQDCAV